MVEQAELPAEMPGHWDTSEGREIALRSLTEARADLCKGDVSDLALANAVFMASRDDLDLIVWQTAAKERIRWLSAQLALASTRHSTDFERGLEAGAKCAEAGLDPHDGYEPGSARDSGRYSKAREIAAAIRNLIPPAKP